MILHQSKGACSCKLCLMRSKSWATAHNQFLACKTVLIHPNHFIIITLVKYPFLMLQNWTWIS